MNVKIKICGLSSSNDIKYANNLKVDYIGFVFAKSKRQVTALAAKALKAQLNSDISAVGVFVNEPVKNVIDCLNSGIIDIAQLHGSETEDEIQMIKSHCKNALVIKAIKVSSVNDIISALNTSADYLLLDNGMGTGKTFDWNILKAFSEYEEKNNVCKKFFLAGGLTPENVHTALNTGFVPYALDVSSGVETDGVKNNKRMADFVAAVNKENKK